MIEIELDGKTVAAKSGSTVLEVALREGKYIPHFCYHKKLSIVANCRMCLVEVEKSPKPLPACATPITEGMKIHTCSKVAIDAQKGVMEFLLINHPLDCPICDQGGECQLQDLSMGYGGSNSRFEEDKRAVTNKDLGSLIATEMTRCIHCTRCVRFSEEIAGFQELGMINRTNHAEIVPFSGETVNSELSGNMIDLCPVGALTSKPFRFKARNWELSRRKSVSPHDGLGSNLIVQIDKYNKVLRVLPLENEEINECWISDRDRFSYLGLYHEDRIVAPQIKQNGEWLQVDWQTAIEYAAKSLNCIKNEHGSDSIGVLASATSTTEELFLLQKLMRNFGVTNLDYRLSQVDFKLDKVAKGAKYLGGTIDELTSSKTIVIIGSVLREEQPLLAHRIRQAVKAGSHIHLINPLHQDLLCESSHHIMHINEIPKFLLSVLDNVKSNSGENNSLVKDLLDGDAYIVVGALAKSLPNYSEIINLASQIAQSTHAKFGFLTSQANEVGAELVNFVPYKTSFLEEPEINGQNTLQMLESSLKSYVLLNTELEEDAYNSKIALQALNSAQSVIVLSPFINEQIKQYADVILPISPFTETAGSYVNMEGKWQKFNGTTKPLGDAKPGWKVLRVLANCLNISGFDYESIEDVRQELAFIEDKGLFNNNLSQYAEVNLANTEEAFSSNLTRLGLNGIYNSDSLTRRSAPLQDTIWAKRPILSIAPNVAKDYNLQDGMQVKVMQEGNHDNFTVVINEDLAHNMILLWVNHKTHAFGGRFDPLELQVIS